MKEDKCKAPKTGGAKRIKEAFNKNLRKGPSESLLEILKKKPSEPSKNPEKKIAKPSSLPGAEL